MTIKIPDNFRGKPIDGAMKLVLNKENPKIITQKTNVKAPNPSKIANAGNYIILEGRKHGNYEYPDTLVEMERSPLGKNWFDAHEELNNEGCYMLTIRQFADFLSLLKSGNAYDGKGKQISGGKLTSILNEIVEVRDPWRAEWLDAKFEKVNGVLRMNYQHYIVNRKLEAQRKEDLASCLMESKTPGIDMNDWLSNANYQGLPSANVKKGKLCYWKPEANYVAGFNADSDGAYLVCSRDPTGTDSYLGVRRSREMLEMEIERFVVVERDGLIIGCAALYPFRKEKVGELACLAVHPDYRNQGRGDMLLQAIEQSATELGIKRLFVLTTRTAHWFRERGFRPADIKALPIKRRAMYNYQRNSKVFIKNL